MSGLVGLAHCQFAQRIGKSFKVVCGTAGNGWAWLCWVLCGMVWWGFVRHTADTKVSAAVWQDTECLGVDGSCLAWSCMERLCGVRHTADLTSAEVGHGPVMSGMAWCGWVEFGYQHGSHLEWLSK